MTEMLLASPVAVSPQGLPHEGIRDALMESRQRWRHLVSLAADLAFETDSSGRFVLIMPDSVLGWRADLLVGQPSDLLVGDDGSGQSFNPFTTTVEIRRHRAWLRRADGTLAILLISATPLHDAAGHVIGARGIGLDLTDCDAQNAEIAGRLRRGEILHHVLARVGQETNAGSMMDAALWALVHALGAEGAAVIGAVSQTGATEVLHACGSGAGDVLQAAAHQLSGQVVGRTPEPVHTTNGDGRVVLVAAYQTRSGASAGLTIWRQAGSRPWDQEDTAVAGAAVHIVRMILEYEGVQREMAHQARTDPLTGLLNRRAFIGEMRRQIARQDRESDAGTLMFVDVDAFKEVNDRLGHATGDKVLVHLSDMLRKLVRPFDLVTRLGGDEFAVWLSGADYMTAAERADHLCKTAPVELQAMLPEAFPKLGLSIGIATRKAGSQESIEDLTRRADMAMYEVKRSGRRHWRVSLLDGD